MMYLPAHFSESRPEVLHALISACPLAALVTTGPAGLEANHIPFHLEAGPAGQDRLLGHVARANPLWKQSGAPVEALAIFQGPASYISPSWYPAKQEHGRVVPTWNYVVVHAHGRLYIHDDPAWIRHQIDLLTRQMEVMRQHPWAVADAPADYVERLVRSIVGVELVIDRLAGKWKVSQNQDAGNRAGVVRGLESEGTAAAGEMARLVRERSADAS